MVLTTRGSRAMLTTLSYVCSVVIRDVSCLKIFSKCYLVVLSFLRKCLHSRSPFCNIIGPHMRFHCVTLIRSTETEKLCTNCHLNVHCFLFSVFCAIKGISRCIESEKYHKMRHI